MSSVPTIPKVAKHVRNPPCIYNLLLFFSFYAMRCSASFRVSRLIYILFQLLFYIISYFISNQLTKFCNNK